MVKVNFVTADKETISLKGEVGYSIMEVGYKSNIPNLPAECGGASACGTCHVYVCPEWFNRTGEILDNEDSMLFMVNERRENSRLSCQIKLTEEMDGIVVELADNNL